MNKATKHPLQTVADDLDLNAIPYSGRCMYGKTCLGISLSSGDIGEFIAGVIEYTASLDMDLDESQAIVSELTEGMRSMSSDSLGRGMVFYFPWVKFVG